jgi:hypothetical protein
LRGIRSHTNTYAYCDSNSYGNCHADSNSYANCDSHCHTEDNSNTEESTDSSTAAVEANSPNSQIPMPSLTARAAKVSLSDSAWQPHCCEETQQHADEKSAKRRAEAKKKP